MLLSSLPGAQRRIWGIKVKVAGYKGCEGFSAVSYLETCRPTPCSQPKVSTTQILWVATTTLFARNDRIWRFVNFSSTKEEPGSKKVSFL